MMAVYTIMFDMEYSRVITLVMYDSMRFFFITHYVLF